MKPQTTEHLEKCPRCGGALEPGFCSGNVGLTFIESGKLKRFIFGTEDLAKARWRMLVPAKARYYRSYLCRVCHLYLVDHGKVLTHKEATEIASVMTQTPMG